jgi:DNA-binding XRE family transcriptional regulator
MPTPARKGHSRCPLLTANQLLKRVRHLVTSPDVTGKEVRDLRKSLGYSTRRFSEILKVSRMTIVRAERGTPSRALILYIERALADGSLKLSDRKVDPE